MWIIHVAFAYISKSRLMRHHINAFRCILISIKICYFYIYPNHISMAQKTSIFENMSLSCIYNCFTKRETERKYWCIIAKKKKKKKKKKKVVLFMCYMCYDDNLMSQYRKKNLTFPFFRSLLLPWKHSTPYSISKLLTRKWKKLNFLLRFGLADSYLYYQSVFLVWIYLHKYIICNMHSKICLNIQ